MMNLSGMVSLSFRRQSINSSVYCRQVHDLDLTFWPVDMSLYRDLSALVLSQLVHAAAAQACSKL